MTSYNVQPSAFVRPLQYWLDSDASALALPTTPSKLRDIAWIYGQLRGMCAAFTGIGAALAGGALLALIRVPDSLGLIIPLAAVGLGLLLTSYLVTKRQLPKVARMARFPGSRAPGVFRSGLGLALFFSVILGAMLGLVLSPWAREGTAGVISIVIVFLLFLMFTFSTFAGPSWFAEHARRDFRRYIDETPALKAELEVLSLTWRDPIANRDFGPL